MRNFAGIEDEYCTFENAATLLQSIPYDGTSTWGKGADKAFPAFLEALENMELYDIETNSEVYQTGVHILPDIVEDESPEAMVKAVYQSAKENLETGKFTTYFGGEHSVSIGVIRAFHEKFDNLTVLQLDAHADLRKEYDGTPFNHACAVHEASKIANLVQVGIRSMDSCELEYLNREQCYFAQDIHKQTSWMDDSISKMTENVYLTIDLDVFDPSIMPSTGTPEPGGLDWYTVISYLRKVFRQKNVVGFDIVELAPQEGQKAPDFLTAKLYYKLLSYRFESKSAR
ncbi:agmatinase [Marinifilum sp. D737]|uniref:agmatinase n=1 Tax=Marinifilum sp. D737 TaxID=2969628 RepID=UPI002274B7FA|nr:agmatinase [Marinifilum sp. D737]MCY1636451.1 agmatinase [Marinifilum sp. D737]